MWHANGLSCESERFTLRNGFRILTGLAFVVSLAVAMPATASTLTYEYLTTPTDSGPGAGILYTMVIDTDTNLAKFTVSGATTASEVWYADWFTFKFVSGSQTSDLSGLSVSTSGSTGSWSVADYNTNQNVKVLAGSGNTYNKLLEASASGFYLTSIASGQTAVTTDGICLTAGFCSSDLPTTFSFTLTLPDGWYAEEIPFQVGYYDGIVQNTRKGTFKITINQLSDELSTPVPDGGATIGLLGVTFLGLALLRRRFS